MTPSLLLTGWRAQGPTWRFPIARCTVIGQNGLPGGPVTRPVAWPGEPGPGSAGIPRRSLEDAPVLAISYRLPIVMTLHLVHWCPWMATGPCGQAGVRVPATVTVASRPGNGRATAQHPCAEEESAQAICKSGDSAIIMNVQKSERTLRGQTGL